MSDPGDFSSAVLSLVSNFSANDVTSESVGRAASALETLLAAATHVYLNFSKFNISVSSGQEFDGVDTIDSAELLSRLQARLESPAIVSAEDATQSISGSFLTVPIVLEGAAGGYVAAIDSPSRSWSDREVGYAQVLADSIAIAIDHGRGRQTGENATALLQTVFELAPNAYYLNDLNGTFVDGNKAAEEMVGFGKDELIGKSFLSLKLLKTGQLPKAAGLLLRNAVGRSTGPDRFDLIRKDGASVPVEIRTRSVRIDGRRLVLGIARDISERTQLERQLRSAKEELEERVVERTQELRGMVRRLESTERELQRSATHDPLTDLPNRYVLTDRIARLLASSGRKSVRHALFMFDVDKFSRVNRDWGRRVADELLGQIARRAEEVSRPEDIVCRITADSFAALIEDVHDERNAAITAARLLIALSSHFSSERRRYRSQAVSGSS